MSGDIFCWGDNSSGQLGAQGAAPRLTPWSWTLQREVSSISCGERHTVILGRDGKVQTRGHKSGEEPWSGTKTPIEAVVTTACGQSHSLAVSSSSIHSWGDKEDERLRSPSRDTQSGIIKMCTQVPVVQVTCGDAHSLALTQGGDVFSWGSNSHGQLGHGKSVTLENRPLPVAALTGIPVTQISAGAAHTLVLTLTGLVYCCGANDHGQLGLGRVDEKGRFNLCLVPALRPLAVSSISCGESHTATLMKDGQVHTFGQGADGQLGNNDTADELRPRLVEGLDGPASQVECGRRHTLVLGRSGQVWAFGNGDKGQMGSGRAEGSLSPSRVQLPWTDGAAAVPKNLKIAAGWNSNFVFISSEKDPKLRQISGRLSEKKLKRWLSKKQRDDRAECEIRRTFSSSSNLVASFTRDDVVSPDEGAVTVDLEDAARTLEQLLAVPWIKSVVEVNIVVLLDELKSRATLRSPEIILLLLLFLPLHESGKVTVMNFPVVHAIAELSDKTSGKLKSLWSSLCPAVFTKQLLVLKRFLAYLVQTDFQKTPAVNHTLEALKLLYKANKTGNSYKVPLSTFHVEELGNIINIKEDLALWMAKAEVHSNRPIFCEYPFVLNLSYKEQVVLLSAGVLKQFKLMHNVVMDAAHAPVLQLTLRRQHLLEDTFRQLHRADHDTFQCELVVMFAEDKLKSRVNMTDFFCDIFKGIKTSGMCMTGEGNAAWFPPKPTVAEKDYFLFGVLCGLSIYNHHLMHLPFPLALFKKLRGIKPTLDDLIELEPSVGGGLRCVLEEYGDEKIQETASTFTIHWAGETVTLDPKDPDKLVTEANKHVFVAAYVNHVFNASVERVFEEFKRGFYKVCDYKVMQLLQPEELQMLMVGREDYDWATFKQNTLYAGGYHARHPNIIHFWQVFDELDEENKKKFLWFVTGSERVHYLGMKHVKMTITVLGDSIDIHRPQALICHKLLMLPVYQGKTPKKKMRKWLLEALATKKS